MQLTQHKTQLKLLAAIMMIWLTGCVSSRYVPEGGYLLDKVNVSVEDGHEDISTQELSKYIRQQPNHKILWRVKMRLGLYNMSGKDTTKWYNRWWRRMGEPPVVYDSTLMNQSSDQLRKALMNKGYLKAEVEADTAINTKKRKIAINYRLHPGEPHRIVDIEYNVPQDTLGRQILMDTALMPVKIGDALDRSRLELQREYIVNTLRNRGYYAFSKEYITFNADTTQGSKDVRLTMNVHPPESASMGGDSISAYSSFLVRNVVYVLNYNRMQLQEPWEMTPEHREDYKDIKIWYGDKEYLRPSVLYDNCFIRTGVKYREHDVTRTYQALSRISILDFVNIKFHPVGNIDDVGLLDCYILLTPGKSQSLSCELEGTNSAGDLGLAIGLGYTHRNLGKGAETFTAKVRGAYESISGNLDGFIHNRYMEYGLDLALNFPKFKAPFLKERFKRKINATTELKATMNYQERPEYTRIVSTAGWSYKWVERSTQRRHTFTPIDINYVYLPESTNDFLDQIAPDNPLLRYSYEDHFIMRMGYSFYHTNKRAANLTDNKQIQDNIFTWRANVEVAGNLLFAINSIFTHRSNFHEVPYKIFGIHYSQYVRGEFDYSITHLFDHRNSLAFHVGGGVAVPYGNSKMVPFEKRFYGGGANGVRGWEVRTLGPGNFPGTNSLSDFIKQCGDIRFIMNLEYRAKLFWVVEGAAFVDAGNVWTIHDYETQPGGMFRFNTFYKQIAASYGIGLRLDFSYFLLRFDLAMKAHNPAIDSEPWPIIHPNWRRDSAFHFSIGYPF